LTALNVTDDMIKAHDENNRLRREIGELREENAALREKLEKLSNG
jgi:cell division protein ZapA (FtsZ GTPase activity inhibitor)